MKHAHASCPVRIRYVTTDGTSRLASGVEVADVAFEDCAPVRDVPHFPGQWHTPGWYWSATTATLLAYESFLERQWLALLDFDPTVAAIATQPMEIHGRAPDGVWQHVPDVFARRVDGSALLVDVKHPSRQDDRVERQRRRTVAVCAMLGWDYRMVGIPPAQRYANIDWLAGYRRPLRATAALASEILGAAADPVSIDAIATATRLPELAKPVIFHLLWTHRLVCDLDTAPLRDRTLVRSSTEGPA